ncbi:nuclear protein SET [Sediminispirochaeta smaragdinae DSM 11293]|jgi:hypothetical protein|uniref:Nuclear protein SET n=2 Tax=Sediminispirochaeta TaxID=1911556 RepID=E1RBD9_SEDSS|nr:nuclear protein SET [Sediminispirochaeta smaragdinae DSM 11293]
MMEMNRNIRQHFFDTGLMWLTRPRLESEQLRKLTPEFMLSLDYFLENREEFLALERLYGNAVRNGVLASFGIASVDKDIGLGLFAAEPLKREDFVGEYTGIVREAREIDADEIDAAGHYPDDWAWDYPVDIPGLPPLEIDAATEGNPLRYVNHSLFPNLRPDHFLLDGVWVIIFVADRDIERGEELTIDYGDAYWSDGFRELVLREGELEKLGLRDHIDHMES